MSTGISFSPSSTPAFGFASSTTSLRSSTSAFGSSPFYSSSSFSSLFSQAASGNPASGATTAQTSSNRSQSLKREDDSEEMITFLRQFFVAFKEQNHTDIQLKPNNGPCIPAHKALLAARSEIFKNILGSDGCKAPPSDTDTITLSELNTEELESFLEFLYTGNLPADKLKEHVFSLYAAADKYEIPFLRKSCERYLLNSLSTSNALEILELSDAHSNKTMKETTLNFIVANMKDIVSAQKYEDLASSNPHLCVQMTRAAFAAKRI